MRELLERGSLLKITVNKGDLKDVNMLVLFKKDGKYWINSIETGRNLICVEDYDYIEDIVEDYEEA